MMLAMGGPDHSPACVCHSLRILSGVRYSVRISTKPPVTCFVTIFTPFTAGPGKTMEFSERMMARISGIFLFPQRSPWAAKYGGLLYREFLQPELFLIFAISMCLINFTSKQFRSALRLPGPTYQQPSGTH